MQRRRKHERADAFGIPCSEFRSDQASVRHTRDYCAIDLRAIHRHRDLRYVIVEALRRIARERAGSLVAQRERHDAMMLCERIDRRTHPLPTSLQAGNDDDWNARALDEHQLRSGFAVLSVCRLRASVLRSPSRLMNASRSRSSKYCSDTVVACGTLPPPKM